MIKELLFNKEIYAKKYIGLKVHIAKGTTYFTEIDINTGGRLGGYIEYNYSVKNDISGEITGVFLATEDFEHQNVYFVVKYYKNNDPTTYFLMALRKSDVEIVSGGVFNVLLIHVYQLFTRIFRKELIA